MKERSLPNQYLLLETLKRRFAATEVKTGMERARELAEQTGEFRAQETAAANKPDPLASAIEQKSLFEEAA